MKPLIFLAAAVVLFCVPWNAHATGQAPDILLYEGKKYSLFTNPLESLYAKDRSNRPKFMVGPGKVSSGNWRGYIASWEITDGKLFLIDFDSWICGASASSAKDCRRATISDATSSKTNSKKIFAGWYSGELRVPDGKELLYVHMGYGSVFERDFMFKVAAGKVGDPQVIDNTKKPLPTEMQRAREELEKLRLLEEGVEKQETGTGSDFERNLTTPLVAGQGWGQVALEADRKTVESVLGTGKGEERNKALTDVYFREYPTAGFQVSYQHATNKVEAIFLYNNAPRYEGFTTPKLSTNKGISWNSSPEEVLKAYGTAVGDYQSDDGGKSWRRIEFKGIDFRFEHGRMVRIGILPDRKEGN